MNGWPDSEGNATAIINALVANYGGEIIWLRRTSEDLSWLLRPEAQARVKLLKLRSSRAIWRFVTAELVFFTHGLYGGPQPFGPKRLFVNLWHGDGPKRMAGGNDGDRSVGCSAVVAATRTWGNEKARHFGLDRQRILLSGNPRVDLFDVPCSDAQLRSMGLRGELPIVLWAPTYRASGGYLAEPWVDGEVLSSGRQGEQIAEIARAADSAGVQLVVKPHPLDTDRFPSVRVIDDELLLEERVPFYALVARCAALITDYSSIWTDFLSLDRPIALYCPDLEAYMADRQLTVDYREIAPGPLLRTVEEFVKFFEAAADGRDQGGARRSHAARMLGAEVRRAAAVRTLGEVDRLRTGLGRGRLFAEPLVQSDGGVAPESWPTRATRDRSRV